MPGFSSTVALEMVRAVNNDIPFIIVSGSIGEDVAVSAMRAGAQDYLMKDNLVRLVAAVARELKDAEHRRRQREAEHALVIREEEMRIARDVQQLLFPSTTPVVAGYDIAGATCPAEATGGDYFDFIVGAQGELFIVVGDVTGHGLGPALLMTDVRAYLRALILSNHRLENIMVQARHLLLEDLGCDRFITLLFAKLVNPSGELTYINAGHPAGYILAPDGRIRVELNAHASALGIDGERGVLSPEEVPLVKGDLVLFLTDGILEAASASGSEFGIPRVLDIVQRERARPAAEIIRILFEEVRNVTAPDGLQDDITTVIIKYLD
jgi:serine phosphatase RsbU (regulator of sigma subunit)